MNNNEYQLYVRDNVVNSVRLARDLCYYIDENYGTRYLVDYDSIENKELKQALFDLYEYEDKDHNLIKRFFEIVEKNYPLAINELNLDPDVVYVNSREVFVEALRYNAVSIVLLHNHPSGDCTPSRNDILVTAKIKKAGEIMGINLIDHIIIGNNKYTSLKEKEYF
jgi:proteasome lid subunit RPN8/RPN11